MNTNQYLNNLGITMAQARSFIMENMNKPAAIYNAAKQYKIDSQMLAEIVSPLFSGIKAQDVEKFFEVNGLKGYTLNPLDIDSNTSTLLWQGAIDLAPLYSFNNNTGNLSTQSLRNAVIAKIGTTKYNRIFDINDLPGASDGVLSMADLGFSHLGNITATQSNYESLFYGTLIKASRNISVSEIAVAQAFVDANASALASEDRDLAVPMRNLLVDIFKDPADSTDPSYLSDTQIANALIDTVVNEAPWVGTIYQDSLFNSLMII